MVSTALFAELLKFNLAYLVRTLDGVSSDKYFIRPEGRGNPLIWLLGHLVLNRGEIVELLGGDPSTRDLGDLFARGTKPQSDTGLYPKPQQLMTRFMKLESTTDYLLSHCDSALLDRPSWGQFESVGQHLAYSYMHETHHIGQVTYVANLPAFKTRQPQTVRGEPKKNSTTKIVLDSIRSVFSQT
jgi:hypothetical protein